MKVVWFWNLAKQLAHLSGALTALLGGLNQTSAGQSLTPAYRLCGPKYSHSYSPLTYVLLRFTPDPAFYCWLLHLLQKHLKSWTVFFGNTEASHRVVKMPLLKGANASGQCPIVSDSLKLWRSHWRGSAFIANLHILYTDGQCSVGVLPTSISKKTHTGPGCKL